MPRRKPVPPPAPKSKGGADKQTLYRPEFDGIVSNLVRLTGSTISEIAEILNVSVATVYNWQARHNSFREALRMPEDVANHRVQLSWYNEAVGYFAEEEDIRIVEGKVLRLKKKVWQRASPAALIFWAKSKMGYSDREQPPAPPNPDEKPLIDGEPNIEPIRQTARRLGFILHQGGKETG
jgi:hypothetical protein